MKIDNLKSKNSRSQFSQTDYIDKVRNIITKRYENKDIPLAYVHAYGCQQNVSDTEKIKGILALMGYGFTDSPDLADFVLYNTCAIRENAEDRVFGNVGALKNQKRRNPSMIIALCGCMMQQNHVLDRIKNSYHHVNIVFGTHVLHKFPEILYNYLISDKRIFDISESQEFVTEGIPIKRDGTIKAWVPIMYGCNKFCTYCIVPYVRGRERSRDVEDIVEECKNVVKQGYKEITLLGQNVNSYGLGLSYEMDFSELLKRLNDIDGEFRIRFMSPHPKDATNNMFDTILNCEKVCNHIHLPVQSGSNRILKFMNRSYTREEYLSLVDYARIIIKDISFTSDIIVGFPGEKYEDFLETLDLIKQVRYNSLFTFIYSKRVGTRAAKMDDPVPSEEKSKWFQELLDVQQVIGEECYKSIVGTKQRVLVDGIGKTDEGFLTGRTEGNIIVDFKGDKSLIGSFVDINITEALRWAVLGEIS